MAKKRKQIFKNVEILDLAAEGKAIAKVNDLVIFVKNAVPGDIADILITKKKKNFYEGIPLQFHKLSEIRTEPRCRHFGVCGGCKWQNIPYEKQLKYKHKQVVEQFKRIGKIEPGEILPIIGAEPHFFYRNKLEFTFSNRRWFVEKDEFDKARSSKALGFHMPGMFDRVLDIEKCWLQPEPSNTIRNEIKKFTREHKFSYYDTREHKGFLRNLVIRNNLKGEFMVIVIFGREDEEKRVELLDFVKNLPSVVSVYYIINRKLNDSYADLPAVHYWGEKFLIEQIGDLKFQIGPKSFFQTNTRQAEKLYDKAKEFAALTGNEIVYDLYTGTGTIALYLANEAKKVIGVEIIREAIEDARINAQLNNLKNAEFFVGDTKDVLNGKFFAEKGAPDVIVLDPPRAGVHKDVLKQILKSAPERIVYVSCNPATQARDVAILSEKYKLTLIQPVDMFPHTHHVENIALLELK